MYVGGINKLLPDAKLWPYFSHYLIRAMIVYPWIADL